MNKRRSDPAKLVDKKTIIYAAVILAAILLPTIFLVQLSANRPNMQKAAIIDQLSSSHLTPISRHPNQTFINFAKNRLGQRFDSVDYYSDNATVENYRQLPSKGYRLIIWRAHSALDLNSSYVAISTSDKDDPVKYDQYMREGKLTLCQITDDPDQYFAINPKFIREAMTGRFEDTVIILMSCNGLNDKYLGTAQALRDKGAKVLISWNEWIDSDNNDDAVTQLLGYLIDENNTINDAVHKIREYDSPGLPPSKLKYYPMTAETAGYRIPDYRQETSAKTHLQQQLLTRRSREQPDNVGAFLRLSRCALGTQTLKSSRNNHAQLATQRVA
jgi:hypothetical protein